MTDVLRRTVPPVAVFALAVALLSGCTPGGDGGDPTAAPGGTDTQTPEPIPSSTVQPVGTPVDVPCDQLVSADTLYVYNPNFGAIDEFTPRVGSAAATALTYQGVACRWQNLTSGENIDVSVAQLDDASLTALKNTAFADSEMVPTYGEEAYFIVGDDGVGQAEVFQGSYWIVAESTAFLEPGDATEIVESVLAALGS
jgi:hypothetical protein